MFDKWTSEEKKKEEKEKKEEEEEDMEAWKGREGIKSRIATYISINTTPSI